MVGIWIYKPAPSFPGRILPLGGFLLIIRYSKRVSQISLLALVRLVLHLPGVCRSLSVSFWISHKGILSGDCCQICVFVGGERVHSFLLCYLLMSPIQMQNGLMHILTLIPLLLSQLHSDPHSRYCHEPSLY